MKKVLIGVLILTATLLGCNKSSEEGGRAGNDKFKLVVPALSTDIKQGEMQTVRVSLERGEGFKQRVKLEMKAPAGLQVEPGTATVESSDKGDVQLKVTVAPDAPLGVAKILVKGTPDQGEATETEIKITVGAK